MSAASSLRLSVLPGNFSVCRLALDSELQMWFLGQPFFGLLRSGDQLTVVCGEENVPEQVEHEAGWSTLKVEGVFDFAATGVLESVLKPLADAAISIFALSTFETDYVLIKTERLSAAIKALQDSGHEIVG